jgi:type I restriction enzyme S subunit
VINQDCKQLKDIAKIYSGVGFPKKLQGKKNGNYPFYKVGDISRNVQNGNVKLKTCENYIDDKELNTLGATLLPENCIVFAKIGEALKLNRRAITSQKCLVDNNAIGVKADTKIISNKYLFYFLNNFDLDSLSRATTVPSVRKSDIAEIIVPTPPLSIQHQIVEKIEELFSDLDNGIANLKKTKQQLESYKQSVLKAAFEGKLTKEWREQQDNLPTPAELKKQIKEERKQYREQQLKEWEQEVEQWEEDREPGRKPRKPRKPYKPDPLKIKDEKYPNEWLRIRLCQICSDITDGDHQAPPKADQGIPFITISNIEDNKIEFTDTFYVGQKYYNSLKKNRRPQYNDILFTVTGSFGIPVIIDFEKEFCFQRHIGLLRSYSIVNKKWLFYLMQSNNVQNQAKKDATGTAQKTVSLTSLRQFIVPYLSQEEQEKIVGETESRLSIIDKVDKTIKIELQKSEALRQSILKKAFEGKLVQ